MNDEKSNSAFRSLLLASAAIGSGMSTHPRMFKGKRVTPKNAATKKRRTKNKLAKAARRKNRKK